MLIIIEIQHDLLNLFPKLGPLWKILNMLSFNIMITLFHSNQKNEEGSREDNPQSTILSFNLGHIGEPMNCMIISKTIDTHLL